MMSLSILDQIFQKHIESQENLILYKEFPDTKCVNNFKLY